MQTETMTARDAEIERVRYELTQKCGQDVRFADVEKAFDEFGANTPTTLGVEAYLQGAGIL